MTTVTFLLYAVVVLVIGFRTGSVIMRAFQIWYDPEAPWYTKILPLLDREMVSRLYKLCLDGGFSFSLGTAAQYMIPGLAGGPIGALMGLMVSTMIQSGGFYRDHLKRKYRQNQHLQPT